MKSASSFHGGVGLDADPTTALEERSHHITIGRPLTERDAFTANGFIRDRASRLTHRVQVTTDGHEVHLEAIEGAFGADEDWAMLVKFYGADGAERTRYSPVECTGTREIRVTGHPDPEHISTSYVETPEPRDADAGAALY